MLCTLKYIIKWPFLASITHYDLFTEKIALATWGNRFWNEYCFQLVRLTRSSRAQ